jgi:hypothetical protein
MEEKKEKTIKLPYMSFLIAAGCLGQSYGIG